MAAEKVVPMTNEEKQEEEVKPIKLLFADEKEELTLEFSRESVKFAEGRGFKIDDVGDYPQTGIEDLFWYSFRMHHPRISKEQSDRIMYEKLGGLTKAMVVRLGQLYNKPFKALMREDDEPVKNPNVTVEM